MSQPDYNQQQGNYAPPPPPPGGVYGPPTGGYMEPHRGGVVFALGIAGLVLGCLGVILGPIAWTMGHRDLKKMATGAMDPSGRGMAQAGKICGMIATIIYGLLVLAYVVFMFVMALISAGNVQ